MKVLPSDARIERKGVMIVSYREEKEKRPKDQETKRLRLRE